MATCWRARSLIGTCYGLHDYMCAQDIVLALERLSMPPFAVLDAANHRQKLRLDLTNIYASGVKKEDCNRIVRSRELAISSVG